MIYINLLLIFLFLVAIHEYGHYIVARFFGAEVTDFSIGFGKAFLNYTDKQGTTWKIAPIPLGGYVKIKGFNNIFSQDSSLDNEKGSFLALSLFQKICVLLAGSFFNIISAWIALFCIMFFFGIATILPIVGGVVDNSAAFNNDIREGDKILEINNIKIDEFFDIPKALGKNKNVNLIIERNNKIISKNIDLNFNDELKKYVIGISAPNNPEIDKYNFIRSLKDSTLFIPTFYAATFTYLSKSFKENTLVNELSGPVGVVKFADQMKLDKLRGVLFLFIIISLSVGLFNLFCIPMLDGGHILYFIIRRIFSNSLPEIVTRIYLAVGISTLLFLFLVVTYNDIFYK